MKFRLITFLTSCIFGTIFAADNGFPESQTVGVRKCPLVGEGTLRVAWVKVYDIALYLENPEHRKKVLQDVPKRLDVRYLRDVAASDLIEAGDKVLRRTWTSEELRAIQGELDQINSWYIDAKKGDMTSLFYEPNVGTFLIQNGKTCGPIPGAGFSGIYFSIWLGSDPANERLRDQLLAAPGRN